MPQFEIKVEGNLGTYRQAGSVDIGPKDVADAVKSYFLLCDPENPSCPDTFGSKIIIHVDYKK